MKYIYYKNTYNYEINVWIWGALLVIFPLIIGIISFFRFKYELNSYKKKKGQHKLIKQELLINYSIEEIQKILKVNRITVYLIQLINLSVILKRIFQFI